MPGKTQQIQFVEGKEVKNIFNIKKYFSAQPSRRGSFYERQNSSSYGLENKQPWSVYKLEILRKIYNCRANKWQVYGVKHI